MRKNLGLPPPHIVWIALFSSRTWSINSQSRYFFALFRAYRLYVGRVSLLAFWGLGGWPGLLAPIIFPPKSENLWAGWAAVNYNFRGADTLKIGLHPAQSFNVTLQIPNLKLLGGCPDHLYRHARGL